MQYLLKLRIKRFFPCLVLIGFLFWPINLNASSPNQNLIINCIIFYDSDCPVCYEKYLTYVKPFYNTHQHLNETNFEIIDIQHDYVFYWQEVKRLNIDYNRLDLDNLPWVIFRWDESKEIGLDYRNIEFIEIIYLAILEDPNFNPYPPDNTIDILFELLDPNLVFFSGIFLAVEILVFSSGLFFYKQKWKTEALLRRISKNRITLISILSLISIGILFYQLLDYLSGGCGCATTSLIKSLEFRQYEFIPIFGLKIPISLIGLVLMNAVLIQTTIIGVIKTPFEVGNIKTHQFIINEKSMKYLHIFLLFQSFIAVLSLFYLLYIELYVLSFICLLCTISQIVIVSNTILLLTWSPKRQLQNQTESKVPD